MSYYNNIKLNDGDKTKKYSVINMLLQSFIDEFQSKMYESVRTRIIPKQLNSQLFSNVPNVKISKQVFHEIIKKTPAPPPLFRHMSKLKTLYMTPTYQDRHIDDKRLSYVQRSATSQKMLINFYGQNATLNEYVQESSLGTPNTRGNQYLKEKFRLVMEKIFILKHLSKTNTANSFDKKEV